MPQRVCRGQMTTAQLVFSPHLFMGSGDQTNVSRLLEEVPSCQLLIHLCYFVFYFKDGSHYVSVVSLVLYRLGWPQTRMDTPASLSQLLD